MAVNQSYVGNVANPIVAARLEVAITGNMLGKKLGLSRQYISRAEQGTYSSLNPALVKWVANASNISTNAVTARYQLFQKMQRQATIEQVDPHKLERHDSTEAGHKIFERWRSGYWTSSVAFAIAFCVHPDLVTKYEEGIQLKMPKQVSDALKENELLEESWLDAISRDEAPGDRLTA